MFYIRFIYKKNLLKKWANRSFPLFCEWIAQVDHQKWATMSDLLRSLRGNERCERISHLAHKKWANEWIAHFFEWIAYSLIFWQKTSDSLGNQMSEFPALNVYIQYGYTVYCVYMYANVRKLALEHEDSTLQKLQVVQKCEGALFLLKRIFIRKVKLVNCS